MTIIAAGVVGSAQDLFQFYLPIYGHSLGLSASAIGTILGLVFVAAFVIRGTLPLLVKRLKEPTILISAMFIAALAFTLLPFFSNPWALGAIAFLLGLGVGCAQPMTMSLLYLFTPAGRIAESFGLQKTVRERGRRVRRHDRVPLECGYPVDKRFPDAQSRHTGKRSPAQAGLIELYDP
jgi:MFS family permease